jgi:hypothetical protein
VREAPGRRPDRWDHVRAKNPLKLQTWVILLVVVALVLPAVIGFSTFGPPAGVALGAVSIAAVVVVAAGMRFEEPIEVAAPTGGRYRVLLVLGKSALDEPLAANGVAAIAEHGSPQDGGEEEPEVLVLAPAVGSGVDRWLSDVAEARIDAQTRLALTVGTMAAAGIDARGQVGDPDTVLAIEDVLRVYAAQEVIFAASDDPAIEEVRKRLDRPVRTLS